MQYKMVSFEDSGHFEAAVNRLLELGWRLHGSPFSRSFYLCQALVKG